MQIELCLENHTPQSSPDWAVRRKAQLEPPRREKTEGLEEGHDKKRHSYTPGINARVNHELHRTWANMIQRCTNPNNTGWSRYGGRGITVCERWRDFMKFAEDVGVRPSTSHTLERKDNDGPYCPENIRWATRKEQSQNMRSNHYLEHNGMRLPVSEWARRLGVSYVCILYRIKRGWSVEDAVTLPSKQ